MMRPRRERSWVVALVAAAPACLTFAACSSSRDTPVPVADAGADANGVDAAFSSRGAPQSCADAARSRSYIGCDYWPTVVANNVWDIFDYAVIVANGQDQPVQITITGPVGVSTGGSVPAGGLGKFYLPWVPPLKGESFDECTSSRQLGSSVVALGGAYHLASTLPVSVFQFNALEYKGAGGSPKKDWSSCPGLRACNDPATGKAGTVFGCFSFSNDASLLLPQAAWTGTYRVAGQASMGTGANSLGSYIAVTASADATTVTVKLPPGQSILPGGGVEGTTDTVTVRLNAGDVAQLAAPPGDGHDLSGALVRADKPIQLISGTPCSVVGDPTVASCDHLEESVFPAETLGKHYVVAPPTSPHGNVVGHVVRFFGNVDGTALRYAPSAPPGCPATLSAGEVVECTGAVNQPFEVTGDHEFAVGTYMLSGLYQNPANTTPSVGDPSQSFAVAVEQYRAKYIFLAPEDYDENWADVIVPDGATLTIDGAPVAAPVQPIASGFGIVRHRLARGQGVHTISSTKPVGLEVVGFGAYTSYHYPGGLELAPIAPAPIK